MTVVVSRDTWGSTPRRSAEHAHRPGDAWAGAIAMPHVSGAGDREGQVSRARQIVTFAVCAALALVGIGVVMTLVLWIPLYGPSFRDALPVALVLIPAALVLELTAILGNVLRSLDRPGTVALIETLMMVGSVLMLLAALQIDPLMGPAVASLLSYSLTAVAMLAVVCAQLRVRRESCSVG